MFGKIKFKRPTMLCFSALIFCFSILPTLLANNIVSLKSEQIIDGLLAKEKEFMYVVSLQSELGNGQTKIICSGSLITPHFALTAAHCVMENEKFDNQRYVIVGGTIDLQNVKKAKGVFVKNIYTHIDYDVDKQKNIVFNDIAMLELETSLDIMLNFPLPILTLPEKNSNYANQVGVLAGYGKSKILDSETGKHTIIESSDSLLRYTHVNILTESECVVEQIIDNLFCGQTISSHRNIINIPTSGDSGGALVINGTIVGIISTVEYDKDKPTNKAYFTKVSIFRDFIDDIINGHPSLYTTSTYILKSIVKK